MREDLMVRVHARCARGADECVRPYTFGTRADMTSGHLTDALLALYTEILCFRADIP